VPNRTALVVLAYAWRAICRMLLHVLPPQPHVVVHGWPDDEGNAVEMVRALRRRYAGRVVWLLSDPTYPGPAHTSQEMSDTTTIVRVRKGLLQGVLPALTAEATFFTHGLFTAVQPPADRLVVNLWHGDGPKLARDTHLIHSTVVAGTTAPGSLS
jgi:CDP-glycerol glycerophosphotransferase